LGTAVISGIAAPIRGSYLPVSDTARRPRLLAECSGRRLDQKPEWVVNDPIEVRFEKEKLFLKRAKKGDVELRVIKMVKVPPSSEPKN
jgi:hypothetical protein